MRAILFITAQLIFELCIGQYCVYTDAGSGRKLYLDALEHATLRFTADEFNDKHTYTYTPCRNAAGECPHSSGSGGINTAMCRQTLADDADMCTVIANVDSSVAPTYNSAGNGTWEFAFQNGDDEGCGAPRSFNVFFVCDMKAGDYQIHSAGELGPSCTYEFNIRTKWACPGQVYVESDTSSLSGGWIFVIIFLSIVFAYFVGGWIICAYLNRKDRGFGDIAGNIPHVTFWTKVPALTYAGCCFTKDFLLGLCSKGDTSGLEESSGANDGNYETIEK